MTAADTHAYAVCPTTGEEINPLSLIPTDWQDIKPPVIVCPSCGNAHEWRPTKGVLINVEKDREGDAI